jgi:membrane protease YdiL (CAAX protease family)
MMERIKKIQLNSIFVFLLISYGFSWLVWLPGILSTNHIIGSIPWNPLFAMGACGPMVAAFFCKHQETGWGGIKEWLNIGFKRKLPLAIWMLMLTIPFLVPALGLGFYLILGNVIDPLPIFHSPFLIFPTFFLMVTIGGGQEEYGWRGYLLDQLDEKRKTWQTDLIMVIFHSFWHLPLFFISYTAQYYYPFWVFLLFGTGFTLLSNSLYRKTDGSILAAILFHGFVNTGLEIFPPVGPFVHFSYGALIIIAILYCCIGMGFKLMKPTFIRRAQYGKT